MVRLEIQTSEQKVTAGDGYQDEHSPNIFEELLMPFIRIDEVNLENQQSYENRYWNVMFLIDHVQDQS